MKTQPRPPLPRAPTPSWPSLSQKVARYPASGDVLPIATAERMLNRGNNDAAISHARRWARLEPRNPRPHVVAGVAFLRKGCIIEARGNLFRALEIEPSCPPALYNLAAATLKLGDEAAALRFLQAAVVEHARRFPGNPDFLKDLASRDEDLAPIREKLIRDQPSSP